MFNNILNLPYLFLLIPLIFSVASTVQNYQFTNDIFVMSTISCILFLSLYLLPDVLPNISIKNKINNEIISIFGEYKIDFLNLFFLILIFFSKLISFIFFDKEVMSNNKLNFFFSIFLINYFAISGLFISNNIFNIYLYMELYSFSLYNLLSDYKWTNYSLVSYNYYNNGVLSSILFIFFVFIVYLNFGSADIDYIHNNINIISSDYIYNSLFFVFIASIVFKFFSFNFYLKEFTKAEKITNLLFINILFSDVLIGVYLYIKLSYSIFDMNFIMNSLYINYLFYFIGSLIVIFYSIKLYRKKNLLSTIYNFSLITLGYIIILCGLNNNYSFVSIISFLINHTFIDFLFYLIVALIIFICKKSDIPTLHLFSNHKYMIYCILLSKLCFPIASGFNSNWNYILSVSSKNNYYLFIPFVFEKIVITILLTRYYLLFTQQTKEQYVYIDIYNKISLNSNFLVSIIVIFVLIIIISFFENPINNILFNYININNNL